MVRAVPRRDAGPVPNLTIITYGLMRQVVEQALEQVNTHTIDLVDLRTIYPVDWVNLLVSVKKSQNVLIVEPDVQYGGVGAEIAATLAEYRPGTKVVRLGARRETIPASMALHANMLPTVAEVIDAIDDF